MHFLSKTYFYTIKSTHAIFHSLFQFDIPFRLILLIYFCNNRKSSISISNKFCIGKIGFVECGIIYTLLAFKYKKDLKSNTGKFYILAAALIAQVL